MYGTFSQQYIFGKIYQVCWNILQHYNINIKSVNKDYYSTKIHFSFLKNAINCFVVVVVVVILWQYDDGSCSFFMFSIQFRFGFSSKLLFPNNLTFSNLFHIVPSCKKAIGYDSDNNQARCWLQLHCHLVHYYYNNWHY